MGSGISQCFLSSLTLVEATHLHHQVSLRTYLTVLSIHIIQQLVEVLGRHDGTKTEVTDDLMSNSEVELVLGSDVVSEDEHMPLAANLEGVACSMTGDGFLIRTCCSSLSIESRGFTLELRNSLVYTDARAHSLVELRHEAFDQQLGRTEGDGLSDPLTVGVEHLTTAKV